MQTPNHELEVPKKKEGILFPLICVAIIGIIIIISVSLLEHKEPDAKGIHLSLEDLECEELRRLFTDQTSTKYRTIKGCDIFAKSSCQSSILQEMFRKNCVVSSNAT